MAPGGGVDVVVTTEVVVLRAERTVTVHDTNVLVLMMVAVEVMVAVAPGAAGVKLQAPAWKLLAQALNSDLGLETWGCLSGPTHISTSQMLLRISCTFELKHRKRQRREAGWCFVV
jgi:hypothetical protein